jgi:Domain of unknown function (DUF1906)
MIIDTNISCLNQSQFLLTKGVTAVGRYYRKEHHPEWAVTQPEAQELSTAKIKLFMVWEDYGQANMLNLTQQQGATDAGYAVQQAHDIGQPPGSAIYFAVEGLPDGYTSADLPQIRDYFAGVKSVVGGEYELGVYGDGVVCSTLLQENICKFTWLAAASTSFEGTCKFFGGKSPSWDLAQVPPLELEDDWSGLSVDVNLNNPRRNGGDFGAFLVPT